MMIGCATVEGTMELAREHPELSYQELGRTGWLVSQAGFGCYRVDVREEEHRNALRKALLSGVNLIDTSANYADGRSEELVGAVLAEMLADGAVERSQVVVVSKAGYLQGQNYRLSQERKANGRPFPDLVLYGQGLEHCIHPEFLEDQLTRSLERLQMQQLDVYLLHNPEYFLMWAKQNQVSVEAARAEYERRLELAFRHLENEVEKGRILCYGISSNTFGASAAEETHTSLERVLKLAENVSSDNRLRVIQLPMNLVETGGMTEGNQMGGASVVQLAARQRIGVLINRPLNAFTGQTMVRLADVEAVSVDEERIGAMLSQLLQAEQKLSSILLPALLLEAEAREKVADRLSVGALLKQHWQSFSTQDHWREVQVQFLVPTVQEGVRTLLEYERLDGEVTAWVESYVADINRVLSEVTAYYRFQAAVQIEHIKNSVATADKEWAAESLSGMALRALRSTSGVTTVLVGMRREAYVADVVAELQQQATVKDRGEAWARMKNSQW
ncbi:aldo/keto reductase [Tumebacillus algifaecis]|nr:aldo/keto reductase [Tumebacillus algifaecis]